MIPAAVELLRTPRVTAALTTTGIGLVAFSFAAQQLLGWPGYVAALILLDLLLMVSLVARRSEIDWHWAILPTSLLAYLAWAGLSVFWSSYQWVTLGSALYLLLITFVGVYVGLSRDAIQIIRSVGDVLRLLLLTSVVLEIFSGILIDAPIRALSIRGLLATGGPISGVASTRNELGLLAALAVATFVIEWRTRSITRALAIASLALAGASMVFTQSPAVGMVAVVLLLAAAALYGIRRLADHRRQLAQYLVLAGLATFAVLAWAFRSPIVASFNATGELQFRLTLWRDALSFVPLHWIEGWGWIGAWNRSVPPYIVLTTTEGRPHDSALNAIVDLALQLGVVGVVLFLVVVGLAFARSWLLAGRRRSVVHTWPALVLVALITVSVAESTILVDFGWLLFTICCVRASTELSWRSALSPGPSTEPELPEPG